MSAELQALWLLPARALLWSGALFALCALIFLADLALEHWRAGRDFDRDMEDDQ